MGGSSCNEYKGGEMKDPFDYKYFPVAWLLALTLIVLLINYTGVLRIK